jgi:hypothetical protein
MVKETKQVPRKQSRLSAAERALFGTLVAPAGPFPEVVGTGRQYPGAPEGTYLASYLNELSARPKAQRVFTELVSPLQKFERSMKRIKKGERADGPVDAYTERDIWIPYAKLQKKIDRRGSVRITKDGSVIPPESSQGRAALAVLLLYQEFRLTRVRRCLQCGKWFFAHLERQLFCGDPERKCQWKHYHSPEWRRKNREHQRKYREGLFGKGR